MKFEDLEGMPSGTEYRGDVLHWSHVDNGDFTVAFFAEGQPFGDVGNDFFTWVIESKEGDVLFVDHKAPFHRPIFGLDSMEWRDFKYEALAIIDAFIEKRNEANT